MTSDNGNDYPNNLFVVLDYEEDSKCKEDTALLRRYIHIIILLWSQNKCTYHT